MLRNMIAQMAERLTTNSEVLSSSPRSGSNEIIFSKLKSYCLLQHMVINTHGWMVTEKRHSDLCMLERKVHRQDVRPNTSVHGYWYRRWTETMAIGLITHMSGVGKPCCREPKSLSSMIKALTVYLVYYELKSTDYKWFNQSMVHRRSEVQILARERIFHQPKVRKGLWYLGNSDYFHVKGLDKG